METCSALHARFPLLALPLGPLGGLQTAADAKGGTLSEIEAGRVGMDEPEPPVNGGPRGCRYPGCKCVHWLPAPSCKADADDGEWSHLSGVLVSWIVGRPFRMESGEMYTGDWMYHPGTLANGGPDACSCD